ncbi:MAG: TrmH family RNA methyltransferase [bacterium]|nr:TrmH family RNA methyltransferase [bacterium]
MTKEGQAGNQLNSKELHARQLAKQGKKDGPIVIAVGIDNPFNIGNILRCADATGVKYVYFVETPDLNQSKVNKTSRSAINFVPHKFIDSKTFFSLLDRLPPLIALEITDLSTNIFTTDYEENVGFVVGEESKGIPEEYLVICKFALDIPMIGTVSSLNVATALCIALYDWNRRYGV